MLLANTRGWRPPGLSEEHKGPYLSCHPIQTPLERYLGFSSCPAPPTPPRKQKPSISGLVQPDVGPCLLGEAA